MQTHQSDLELNQTVKFWMQSCNLYFTVLQVYTCTHKGKPAAQGGYLPITGRSYFCLISQQVSNAELKTRNEQKFSANSRHASDASFRAIPELTISNSISPFHVSSSPHEANTLTPFQSSHITLHTIITPSSHKLLGPKAEPGCHSNTALKIPLSVLFLQNKRFKTK